MKDDLKLLWNSKKSPLEVKIEITSTDLGNNKQVKSMIDEIQKANKAIFWRDFREVVAAVFVVIFFLKISLTMTDQVKKVACYGMILAAVLICYKLMEVKTYKKNLGKPNTDLVTYLKVFQLYWQKEIQLLNNAFYWYVLPIYIPLILFSIGDSWSFWEARYSILFHSFLGIFILWLNKKAAKKEKEWLMKIEKQIESLA